MAAGDPVRFIETRAWPMRLMTGALPRPPGPYPAGQAVGRPSPTGPARSHAHRPSFLAGLRWPPRRRRWPTGRGSMPDRRSALPGDAGRAPPVARRSRGQRRQAEPAVARRGREEVCRARLARAHLKVCIRAVRAHSEREGMCLPPAAGLLRRSLGRDAVGAIAASAGRQNRACRPGRLTFGSGPGRRVAGGSDRR